MSALYVMLILCKHAFMNICKINQHFCLTNVVLNIIYSIFGEMKSWGPLTT